jgi:hypothetical protein
MLSKVTNFQAERNKSMSTPGTQLQGYVLSPQQDRVFRLHQGLWDHPFITQASAPIAGPLNVEALESALQAVVRRHAIFRATFHLAQGSGYALQVMRPTVAARYGASDVLERLDLTSHGLDEIWLAQRRTIFDLETGPLVKFCLITLGPQSHILLMTLSSLCADGGTPAILVRELAHAYAQKAGDTEEPPQYIQYAAYQDQWLKGDEGQADRNFWNSQHLSPSHTELPFEASSQDVKEYRLETIAVPITPEISRQLRASDGDSLPSAESFFFACWQTLLRRLSGSTEIVSGVCSSGRSFEELESMPGLFARILPVTSSITATDTFLDVWARAEEQIAVARRHQEGFTFDSVGMIDGKTSAQPWFHNVYEYCELPSRIETHGLRLEINRIFSCADRFKLRLSCFCAGDTVNLELDYDPAVFTAEGVELFARYLSVP